MDTTAITVEQALVGKEKVMAKYRYLRSNELIREGDERFDYEFGWTVMRDNNLERFSNEYRRVGRANAHAKRWRRRIPND